MMIDVAYGFVRLDYTLPTPTRVSPIQDRAPRVTEYVEITPDPMSDSIYSIGVGVAYYGIGTPC